MHALFVCILPVKTLLYDQKDSWRKLETTPVQWPQRPTQKICGLFRRTGRQLFQRRDRRWKNFEWLPDLWLPNAKSSPAKRKWYDLPAPRNCKAVLQKT